MSALLALWCVFALASEDARAFCLDRGGDCSPSSAVPEGPCHEPAPGGGTTSRCGSCVDILVHEDASARGSRPDHELPAPAVAQSPGSAVSSVAPSGDAIAAFLSSRTGSPSPHSFQRTTVLRI
jgi:hypothetical protein